MKKLDKVILILFSVLILVQSVFVMCLIVGWIKLDAVGRFFNLLFIEPDSYKIILGVEIILALLAIKCIFFDSSPKEEKNNGILMQNDNGKLLISKTTIENIVQSVIKGFESVTNVNVSVDVNTLNDLIVNVNLSVGKDVIIKDLTLNMQNKIKEAIKKTSDLEVKSVNVKIKDVVLENE